MGTRHRQVVITKKGDMKISQYGQWDGNPKGQGTDILMYLKNGNLEKYQRNLENIELVTDEQIEQVNSSKNPEETYPHLNRDCGARIHQLIEDGKVEFVQHISEEEANRHCEGFYTVDFQNGLFISEFHGKRHIFKLDKLPTMKEYVKKFED